MTPLERFRAALARHLGLSIDPARLGELAAVLKRRSEDSPGAYLDSLEREVSREELRALARELTVGETYFFRHLEQLRAFAELVAGRHVRVLSAGCASGEEPFTLVMLALERGATVTVRAVDANAESLQRASTGRYSAWSLRETSNEMRSRWFQTDGRDSLLDSTIRAAVQFEERNLAAEDSALWRPDSYDVVFFRNVLMYFTPQAARAVVARIARSLAPGGYLFLGHVETLRGISTDFHLRHSHQAFYYQKKDGAELVLAPPLETPVPPVTDWVTGVNDSTERIRLLSARVCDILPQPLIAPLATALELVREERFTEALQAIGGGAQPEALLLKAVVLTQAGQLSAAEEACAQLLVLDELNAGAHYLSALCREQAGDLGGAVEHDHVACYLEPAFVMPRLHLGLLLRRSGDRESARRELEQALHVLPQDNETRLQLFGGGFSREGLSSLCKAELRALVRE